MLPARRSGNWARCLLLIPVFAAAARANPPQPHAGTTLSGPALRLWWDEPDHASAIYHVKDDAALTVLVDNFSPEAAELSGEIVFGMRAPGAAPGSGELTALSVIPIAAASIGPGQRARIPIKVTFGAAGSYELRWRHGERWEAIGGIAREASLECIFAPRTALPPPAAQKAPSSSAGQATAPATGRGSAATAAASAAAGRGIDPDSPWITRLPLAAVHHPGFLADYAAQTSVHHFLVEERFSFDAARNVGLGFGASIGGSVREIDALLAEAAQAKASLTVCVTVPVSAGQTPQDKSVAAFAAYVTDAIKRSRGSLKALAVIPAVGEGGSAGPNEALRRAYAAYYLAAYEAARKADKSVALLGAGSARLSAAWLSDPRLGAYVDALAITDAAEEPGVARQFLGLGAGARKAPLLLLPPPEGMPWSPAASGLAVGALRVGVPGPEIDHGVTAHLLGGAVFVQRLEVTIPTTDRAAPDSSNIPFIAVFQGDGYAVAALAGFSAGTDLDALYPSLGTARTEVTPVKGDDSPAYPNLEISDDSRAMRVVDAAGAAVDCRVGDSLYVPVTERVEYVLQGGAAKDLAGSLRVATPNRLPLFEPRLLKQGEGLAVRVRNITTRPLSGTLRLMRPPEAAGDAVEVLGQVEFGVIAPDGSVTLPLLHELPPMQKPLVVELTTQDAKAAVQRTALGVSPDAP